MSALEEFEKSFVVTRSFRKGGDDYSVVAPRYGRDALSRRVRVRIEEVTRTERVLRFAVFDPVTLAWRELVSEVVDHERVDEAVPELVATAYVYLFVDG